jgi:glycosyltransferase involved in cell wall biosynthesis
MKVCLLIGEFNLYSGTSKPIFELAKGLFEDGHDISLIISELKSNLKDANDSLLEKEWFDKLKIIEIPTNVYKFMLLDYKNDENDIIKTLSEADIIHGFNFIELYLTKRALNKLNLKSKVICSISGPFNFNIRDLIDSGLLSVLNLIKPAFLLKLLLPNFVFKKIFNNFDKIVSNSDFVSKQICLTGINPQNIEKIPIAIDINQIVEHNHKYNNNDFIYFGSGSSIRGAPDVLKAFNIVLKKKKDSTLAFYFLGSHGIEEKLYESIIKSDKNFGSSIFLSSGPKSNILNIVKSARAVVLPFRSSIGYAHPPLTVLEAMLLKRVVISTYVGSIPELIQNRINGFLVHKKDSKKIAEKMLLTFDEDLRSKIGNNAQESVLKTYDIKEIVKRTLIIYDKAITEVNK